MNRCENCQNSELKAEEPPAWNAPFSQRKKVTFYAKCLNCGKRLQCEQIFNNLDEYVEFVEKLTVS